MWSQKKAYSILSSVGSTHQNENGVTGDSGAVQKAGQLTGQGNRRPEVIGDVISRSRKSISKEVLAGQFTTADRKRAPCVEQVKND